MSSGLHSHRILIADVQVHYLSGPICCCDEEGLPAKPGDILTVEILNLGPLPGDEWGFGGVFDRDNGGGFLTEHFPDAAMKFCFGAPSQA